jgi:hypothetical protein
LFGLGSSPLSSSSLGSSWTICPIQLRSYVSIPHK